MEITVNSEIITNTINTMKKVLSNYEVISIIIAVMVAIIAKIYLGSKENKSTLLILFEIILWMVLAFVIILNSLKYLFGIEIITSISEILSNNPLISIDINKKEKKKVTFSDNKEVFHISGNHYTYKDAESICKAYGAKLATYDNLERAYLNGAEWCEYGWSDNQMAFFPTQKKTWNDLQKKENKNICGRPGINGGYINNPNVRFGVNCYGVKPDITNKEKCLMDNTSYYLSPDEKKDEIKKNYWESKISDLLISPFNQNTWSRI